MRKKLIKTLDFIGFMTIVVILALWLTSPAPPKPKVVVHKHPVITYVVPTTTTTTPPVSAPPTTAPVVVQATVAVPPPPVPTTTTTTIPVKLSFLAEAQSQIGQVNPPYSIGGFWCSIHVGIVERVNGDGTFTAIEGNGDSATTVIETARPITGVGDGGLDVIEFVLP